MIEIAIAFLSFLCNTAAKIMENKTKQEWVRSFLQNIVKKHTFV